MAILECSLTQERALALADLLLEFAGQSDAAEYFALFMPSTWEQAKALTNSANESDQMLGYALALEVIDRSPYRMSALLGYVCKCLRGRNDDPHS
jgi:hypothetical protein